MEMRQTIEPRQRQRQTQTQRYDRVGRLEDRMDETSKALEHTAVVLERIHGQLREHDNAIKEIQGSPARLRDWVEVVIMALCGIGSGFGCMGCLGSAATVISVTLGILVWLVTHH